MVEAECQTARPLLLSGNHFHSIPVTQLRAYYRQLLTLLLLLSLHSLLRVLDLALQVSAHIYSQMDAREEGLQVQEATPGGARCKTILLIKKCFATVLGKFMHTLCSESEETETASGSCDPSENHTKLKQEMNKQIYQAGLAVNLGLLGIKRGKLDGVEQAIIVANAMGCALIQSALIQSGFLHKKTTLKFGMIMEQVGAGIIIAAIHLLFSTFLLWWLKILIALCCAVSITALLTPLVALNINHNEVPTPMD